MSHESESALGYISSVSQGKGTKNFEQVIKRIKTNITHLYNTRLIRH